MRYLLDSHVFMWLDDPERLGASVQVALHDPENELFLSVATIWELTLKRAAGRLHFTGPYAEAAATYGIAVLPVRVEHVAAVEQLPRLHKDPFDQMLIAQAVVEGLVLVTHDEVITRYPVATMRV